MPKKITEGADVLLFLDKRRTYLIKAKQGQVQHTHKGFINHDDVIGKYYGDRIKSNIGFEFILLKPQIQDYTAKMLRRTQIIYPKDMAQIILNTGIGPGWKVVEAGTGSGALASFIAYHVKPRGRVYSYEVRGEFIETAKKNMEKAGVLKYIEIKNKDIVQGISEKNVDAVVLDLATPWLVVPHAYEALKGGGAFASFSPTIEQVVETVDKAKTNGFVDVETIECFIREFKVERGATRPETWQVAHTGYLTFARKAT